MTTPPMLELRGVRAEYDGIEALHGVDLVVPPASAVAVLGPNGAGKTTLLRTITGLHPITHGQIRIAGRDVTGADPTTLARIGVCSIPEGRGIFPNLTVRENLWMATFVGGAPRATVEDRAYAQFPNLARRRDTAAGRLSGGEQQMLALARAITTDPPLLILDELSMGLAPVIVDDLYGLIAGLKWSGTTIVIVEQFAHAVLDIADIAAVMVQGRVAMTGSPDDMRHRLADAYLGAHLPAKDEPT